MPTNSRRRQSPWQTVRDASITFRRRLGAFERNPEREGYALPMHCSDTFRFEEAHPHEAVALAEMFLCKPETADMTEHVLKQYFRVGAVQPCTLNQRVNVVDADGDVTAATAWKRVPAVQFYRVVEDPLFIVKKQLLRDSQNVNLCGHGLNAVSISAVYKMETDQDKVDFCRSLMGNRLIDFMRPHSYVHWSSLTRVIERPVVLEDQPDSSDDEYVDEAAPGYEPTSPNYTPTPPPPPRPRPPPPAYSPTSPIHELASPVYEPGWTPSPPGSPFLSANPVAGTADRAKALQHISNTLFDVKETMPDDSYRKLSESLKRSFDEISNPNPSVNVSIGDGGDDDDDDDDGDDGDDDDDDDDDDGGGD